MKTEIIKFYIKPNSSTTRVDGKYLDMIKIRISKPPYRGEANEELMKFLSFKLGVPRKDISIISGEKSNYKKISIKNLSAASVKSKLLL